MTVSLKNRLAIVDIGNLIDEAIATDIVDAMKRNALVATEGVHLRVASGVVKLSGSFPNLEMCWQKSG